MGIVALQREILIAEGEQILDLRIEAHPGQRAGFPGQLQPSLLQVG